MSDINNFDMPDVRVGAPVVFYATGQVVGHPMLGYVVRVARTGRTIMIRTSDGRIFEGVRHCDDPKLDLSVEIRETGCWDFTPEWKRQEADRVEIKARLSSLEARSKPSKKAVATA